MAERKGERSPDDDEVSYLSSLKEGKPNFAIIVQAIGRWRASPRYPEVAPEWALEACAEQYRLRQIAVIDPLRPTKGPRGFPKDGLVMELTADLIQDPEVRAYFGLAKDEITANMALKSALKIVYGTVEDSALRRLWNYWKKQRSERLEAAAVRRSKHFFARVGARRGDPAQPSMDEYIAYLESFREK